MSKFLFNEFLYYGVKPMFFRLAIQISRGVSLSLAPLYLGHLYSQLDLLHRDEVKGASYHVVYSSLHCTML